MFCHNFSHRSKISHCHRFLYLAYFLLQTLPTLQKTFYMACEIFKKSHDAGVPLLCGTESGFSMTPYGEWHYRELEVFVNDIGMSNLESIVCATKNASKAMKMEGEVGTLEDGMLADILILDENPLNDITVLGDKSKISSIILNGNEVDRTKPEPEITPPQGWRLSPYSDKILTQKVAKNR